MREPPPTPVLFVHHRSELGGAPASLSYLIRELDPEQFEAHIYCPPGPAAELFAEAGASLFTENGCAGCHTFGPANATGTTGPPLDDLAAQAQALGREPEEFVRESIVDPDAVVTEGYPAGVMPKTFGQLPEEQVNALVQYLLGAKGA